MSEEDITVTDENINIPQPGPAQEMFSLNEIENMMHASGIEIQVRGQAVDLAIKAMVLEDTIETVIEHAKVIEKYLMEG